MQHAKQTVIAAAGQSVKYPNRKSSAMRMAIVDENVTPTTLMCTLDFGYWMKLMEVRWAMLGRSCKSLMYYIKLITTTVYSHLDSFRNSSAILAISAYAAALATSSSPHNSQFSPTPILSQDVPAQQLSLPPLLQQVSLAHYDFQSMLMRMEAAASVATSHCRCGGRYVAATR